MPTLFRRSLWPAQGDSLLCRLVWLCRAVTVAAFPLLLRRALLGVDP
jgi:hypothetical protein